MNQSSLYQSAPVGYSNQPDFINAVAEVSTQLSPENLLEALLNIEIEAGRERPFANAPRVLDLDLLLYDDVRINTEKLTLPHPRMFQRAFALILQYSHRWGMLNLVKFLLKAATQTRAQTCVGAAA